MTWEQEIALAREDERERADKKNAAALAAERKRADDAEARADKADARADEYEAILRQNGWFKK